MKQNLRIYLIAAFGWTWFCWIGAYLISLTSGYSLLTGGTLFDLLALVPADKGWLPQLLFAVGVYGPLIGFLLVGRGEQKPISKPAAKRFAVLAVLLPLMIGIPTVVVSLILGYFNPGEATPGALLGLIGLYFISNFLTSGTEELGWRGFLFPYLRQKAAGFWLATWKGGIIWAVWHYPLMVILYLGQGPWVLLPTLVGFTAGIVAMNYITNFIYVKTQSLPLVMGFHALNNTVNFAIMLVFPGTPLLFLTSLTAWAVVAYLDKKQPLA
ncbi:CPBP family intramembrane glutamic endopeptidase [Acetobacterium wieringae]|uniref:CPBP family intramembrane glutamic endopeptidase n=1 Tax=Acetobacterium wieringae TaxID=52694 RepID=UPI002033BFBD|nr:CPBP family intramembrane glutamic endopeptidase [Acetobacterium wieringae]URN82775.1 CPBP family intramembrane metalloprotease [Acetobacterium wieringae]